MSFSSDVPRPIEELLHRRTDLSTFLVHLSKDLPESATARANLLAILASSCIEARTAYGPAVDKVRGSSLEQSQKAVCFTETPLEHTWMMCESIQDRSVRLTGYGLAFAKDWARRKGINPVWYQDNTPGHEWLLNAVKELLDDAGEEIEGGKVHGVADHEIPAILKLAPFIEQMGEGERVDGRSYRKDFAWEREWRHRGDLRFEPNDVIVIFAPESDHEAFVNALADVTQKHWMELPPLLDATWGLEKMITTLSRRF